MKDSLSLDRQGFLAFLHLASCNVWIVFWADLFHKVARKTSKAINTADGGTGFLRKINRLFRMLRGPWNTGKFGRWLAEARGHLLKQLENNNEAANQFVEKFLASIANDKGLDQESFNRATLIQALKKKGSFWSHNRCACVCRKDLHVCALAHNKVFRRRQTCQNQP